MHQQEATDPVTAQPDRHPARDIALGLGIGIVAAIVGMVPWLVTGMRLPLQNLWAGPTLPEDMPRALLPFSQYAVVPLVCMLVVGYGAAGVTVRAWGERRPRGAAGAAAGGSLLVHLVATVQTAVVVVNGLSQRSESAVYLAALLAVVVIGVLVGLLVLRLITEPARAGATIGLTLAALAAVPWVTALLAPPGSIPGETTSSVLTAVHAWLGAVLVGAAIAWGGFGTRGRIAAAVGALLLLWVVPAGFTAVSAAAGSRVLLPYPAELLEYGLGVLRAAATVADVVVPRVLVALAVAAVGAALSGASREWTRRARG